MPKKKSERLTKVPEPTRRAPASGKSARKDAAAPYAAPDLSHIIEPLRALAVPCSELVFDPANPRTHDEQNLNAIKSSLRVYGQRKPVVVNQRTGAVEAGNGTLQALLAMGHTYVAAVYVDDDPTTAAGYSVADNRASELAEWDDAALKAILDTVQTDDQELADMFTRLAEEEGIVPPDFKPVTEDEQGKLDEK